MKHAIVTGAAGGIGAGICRALDEVGYQVTAVDVREVDRTGAVVADLGDAATAECVVSRAWDANGPVDVVVNCAGLYPSTPFLRMTARMWDRVYAVNVRAAMSTTADLARRCVSTGRSAAVVNISSGAARRGRPGATHYSSSKAALEMLTRSAAVELGPHGIRVNAVSPGFVEVDSEVNPVTPAYADAVSDIPLGRRGAASDISSAVLWLVGESASWVTGSVLRVDGGASAGTTRLPLHWPEPTETQSEGAR